MITDNRVKELITYADDTALADNTIALDIKAALVELLYKRAVIEEWTQARARARNNFAAKREEKQALIEEIQQKNEKIRQLQAIIENYIEDK